MRYSISFEEPSLSALAKSVVKAHLDAIADEDARPIHNVVEEDGVDAIVMDILETTPAPVQVCDPGEEPASDVAFALIWHGELRQEVARRGTQSLKRMRRGIQVVKTSVNKSA